ncbi:hypothetical protein LPJ75_004661 [Coemansia sp. RSA 2598]|nr:hypothetical protein LPJ75_004661 [Coemansia sp. RSA 2598]
MSASGVADFSSADKHDLASTPVMTTSGAAALAAAQAAAAHNANSSSSHQTTPQRSRGGSTTHLGNLGCDSDQMDTATPAIHIEDSEYVDSSSERPIRPRHKSRRRESSDGFSMNIDAADEMADDAADSVESKLARRVASSEERLELLLRLLSTCQEYWADHDYVQMLRDMLSWPDEWTTSMQMLERLLLELRID